MEKKATKNDQSEKEKPFTPEPPQVMVPGKPPKKQAKMGSRINKTRIPMTHKSF